MAEVRLKAKAKSIANFKRGSDLLTYQIYIYINSRPKGYPVYIEELQKVFNKKYGVVYKAVKQLEEQGYLKKIRSYPKFWIRT